MRQSPHRHTKDATTACNHLPRRRLTNSLSPFSSRSALVQTLPRGSPGVDSAPVSKSKEKVPFKIAVPLDTVVPVRNKLSSDSLPLYSTNTSWFCIRRKSQPIAPPRPDTSWVCVGIYASCESKLEQME